MAKLDSARIELQKSLDKQRQAEMGQFLTPVPVASILVGMFNGFPQSINLLDPGAGAGNLSATFIAKVIQAPRPPKEIRLTAFEIDPLLIHELESNLETCKQLCEQFHIDLHYEIRQEDFILASVEAILSRDSLFPTSCPHYNYAILNPPYKKINSASKARQMLTSVGIETTNLYSAFMWLVMKLLDHDGQMVAIVPRSFCNGVYFKPFRLELLQTMTVEKIHLFDSREKVFLDGDVLQENIIFHARKSENHQEQVKITSSDGPEDEHLVTRLVDYDQFVHHDDPDLFIRIVPDELGQQISVQIKGLTTTLHDLGVTVSTGRVVDYRSRDLLRFIPDEEVIPLIYPGNLQNGSVIWPKPGTNKPSYLASSRENNLIIPSSFYVLVKRFSSKEERRRVYAAVFNPRKILSTKVGIENHVNYFHRRYGGLQEEFAKGLALYLNSSLVDQFFRQFSGHTQVNAADLRNLRYPTELQIVTLGKRIGDHFPSQDEIDKIVMEVLTLNSNSNEPGNLDPIRARKKIREALTILQMLHLPKAQQNDRSALTLLALTNIRSATDWEDASENLIGITEMMSYFRENYGIEYAPNTRETVRRQTVHQFLQLGLITANPDDSSRPINSPKTRYLINSGTLELIKMFGKPEWEASLQLYLQDTASLQRLELRERNMPMLPVTLPDGETLYLSSGGQNGLIKKIVEEFCPRFTPGGKIIYLGDAGEKLTGVEREYFEQIGISIDKHGKMPDAIIEIPEKKWLVVIEAVTSHGPIDVKRHNELMDLLGAGEYGLVFVTAFETRKAMQKYLSAIAWETEVWVAETPSHLIHFDGQRFLGPYPNAGHLPSQLA